MPSTRLLLIPNLEKLKAGLGAAGMAAVAFEAMGPRLLGTMFSGVLGNVIPLAAGVLSAIAAGYLTEVSEKEARLESEAGKERALSNASDR